VVLMAVILPLLLSGFRLGLLGRFLSLAIVALGIDLIWGFTGLLSLGHGIFFALGGYAFAMFLQLNSLERRASSRVFWPLWRQRAALVLGTVLFAARLP
jgi:ABC-type branched-subunit amino acid transport system permease subunit